MNVKFCIQVIFQNFFMMENDLHSFFPRISNNVLFFAMDMVNIARGNIYLHLDNFDPGMDLKWIDHQLIDGQFASTGYPAIYQNCLVSL